MPNWCCFTSNVGKIVSARVASGNWGEKTVDELAEFIQQKIAGIKGFNRRGLYRMKQFYEAYISPEFVAMLENQGFSKDAEEFVSAVLTRLNWTHHRLILSKAKTPAEKLFYLNEACA